MWRVTQLTAASGAGRSTNASWLNPNLLNESACAHMDILSAQRLPDFVDEKIKLKVLPSSFEISY
jgi:hypothetical protein